MTCANTMYQGRGDRIRTSCLPSLNLNQVRHLLRLERLPSLGIMPEKEAPHGYVTVEIPDDLLVKLTNRGSEAGTALRLGAAFSLCSRGELSTSQAAQ
jgi:hypothetical protein